MKHRIFGVLLALLMASAGWGQHSILDTLTWKAPAVSPVAGLTATYAGAPGQISLYYWVIARYPAGVSIQQGPAIARGTQGVAGLGANPVTIRWTVIAGATGYDVIRQITPNWPASNACLNCVVASNTAAPPFVDAGGGVVNWPTAGTVQGRGSMINALVNNRDQPFALLNIAREGRGLSLLVDGQTNLGTNATPVDLTALTGSQQGIGDRVTGTYGTLTSLKGADFRATSTGGAGTFLVGTQSIATTGVGSASVTELMGGNFVASHGVGAATQLYGLIGELDVAAPAAAPTGNFASGILGVLNNSISIQNPTNHPAAVTGAIFDNNAPAEAGVLSLLLLDNVRVAPVGAAFKAVDRTIIAGHGFNYGLDLYYHCAAGVCGAAAEDNSFNIADIKLQNQGLFINTAIDNLNIRGVTAQNWFVDTVNETGAVIQRVTQYWGGADGPDFAARHARGTIAAPVILNAADEIGSWRANGWDGNDFVGGAEITAIVDAAPGVGDMPGALIFSTANDGAVAVTERMRLPSLGGVGVTSLTNAQLGAQANGTAAYCSNCDPTVGVVLACASAGAKTGAMAFKIAGQWDCLSR